MNTKANERQVGGAHYQSDYQHWDFVYDTGMDYFQGQFSRYVSRARRKHGAEDYEKALHYADKAIELGLANSLDADKVADNHGRFCTFNELTNQEYAAIWLCMLGEWSSARKWVEVILSELKTPDNPRS